MKAIGLVLAGFVISAQALTLEQALKNAKPLSYEAIQQQQRIIHSELSKENIDIRQDYQFSLDTQLGIRERYNDSKNDSSTYFNIKKILFDSEYQADLDFSKSNIELEKLRLDYLKLEQKIQIMRAFFAGVLADLEYDYLTQVLALSAVRQNHTQEDFSIGLTSEVDLSRTKTQTQLDLAKRQQSESKQILSRQRLADLLGLSQSPDELDYPQLGQYLSYTLKDDNAWVKSLEQHNSVLKILRLKIASLKHKKQQKQQSWQFKLEGFARLGEQVYDREKNGSYRAGIALSLPFGNEENEQEIKTIETLIQQKQTELAQQNERLSQDMLDLLLKFQATSKHYQALKIEQEYLLFNLDKASLEYEMRLSRNIGNAMVLVTKNDLERAKTEFKLALLIEEMSLLTQGNIL